MNVRSALYFVARLLGDISAVRRGPKAIVKRAARKSLMRSFGKLVNWMLR